MSVKENKAIARRFIEEVWNQRNIDVFDELFAADYVHHDEPCAPNLQTAAELKKWSEGNLKNFPDGHQTIDGIIAEGDQVAVRVTSTATHTQEFWGLAPTGKALTWRWVYTARISDGKIVEGWMNADRMGLQLQIEGKV